MKRLLSGEPYELAGNRLVFTSWFHVRPTWFQWHDRDGRALGLITAESLGPFEAEFRAVDRPWGLRIAAQPAERMGPLLDTERPWEANGVGLGNIIHDDGTYRAWGICMDADDRQWPCYFESVDGLNWERPDLNLVEFQGSRKNNLIGPGVGPGEMTGTDGRTKFFGWSVFKDPSAPPEERYKALTNGEITREQFEEYRKIRPDGWEPRVDRGDKIMTIAGAVSSDGIHWTWLPQPVVAEHADGQMVAYYDEHLRKYVMYTRNFVIGPPSEKAEGPMRLMKIGRRAIGRSETEDFRAFPVSELVFGPGPEMPPSDTFYLNCWTTIPGAPDHQLMFPTIYHQDDDTTSISLASYHQGDLWHFVPTDVDGPGRRRRSPSTVLGTSAFGEWDGGCIFAHPNLIELPNGDFALSYTGYTFPHKYPRGQFKFLPGYAIWPKGRLVGIETSQQGEFVATTVIPPGRKLRVNALTQRAGHILIEAVGPDERALPGRSFEDADRIVGDHHWTPVTWKGQDDLGQRDGEPVVLRFRMDKATVFGLQFE